MWTSAIRPEWHWQGILLAGDPSEDCTKNSRNKVGATVSSRNICYAISVMLILNRMVVFFVTHCMQSNKHTDLECIASATVNRTVCLVTNSETDLGL